MQLPESKIKTIFLIDGCGAALSAILLIALTVTEISGMPTPILYTLAAIAASLALYSIGCFVLLRANPRPYLVSVIVANSLYCILTLGLAWYYIEALTIPGTVYFVLEISIIIILIFFERKTLAKNLSLHHPA